MEMTKQERLLRLAHSQLEKNAQYVREREQREAIRNADPNKPEEEDWESIVSQKELASAIPRKRPRTNYTFNTQGRIPKKVKDRIKLEQLLKRVKITTEQWREIRLKDKEEQPKKKVVVIVKKATKTAE